MTSPNSASQADPGREACGDPSSADKSIMHVEADFGKLDTERGSTRSGGSRCPRPEAKLRGRPKKIWDLAG